MRYDNMYITKEETKELNNMIKELVEVGINANRISKALKINNNVIYGAITDNETYITLKIRRIYYNRIKDLYNSKETQAILMMNGETAKKILERIIKVTGFKLNKCLADIELTLTANRCWNNNPEKRLKLETIHKLVNYAKVNKIDIKDILLDSLGDVQKGEKIEMTENKNNEQELLNMIKDLQKEILLLKGEVDFFKDKKEYTIKYSLNENLIEVFGLKYALILDFINSYKKPINTSSTNTYAILYEKFPYNTIVNEGEFKNNYYHMRNNKIVIQKNDLIEVDVSKLNEMYKEKVSR